MLIERRVDGVLIADEGDWLVVMEDSVWELMQDRWSRESKRLSPIEHPSVVVSADGKSVRLIYESGRTETFKKEGTHYSRHVQEEQTGTGIGTSAECPEDCICGGV